MEQYTDNQYDDDLTIGADDYGDTFQTSDIDLFEFADDDESPISRLRTLVLSIDWEITDEVLLQFNEEILDLKDVWADDKVRMIYLQALEKISRYIYRDKSDAHPNAIKLLLGMYYNLEKIVLSEDLQDDEIKSLLMTDVRKFEKLKKLIAKSESAARQVVPTDDEHTPEQERAQTEDSNELKELKAIVLGIDWEITEKDLLDLREEVMRLEGKYSDSKPKLVFLQGIGTLGAYIRKKKSNAHADAFTLLHAFYEGLEKIVRTPVSLEEEKAVLLPEVEKFNKFKSVIASSLAPSSDDEEEEDVDYEEGGDYEGGDIAPAFADYSEDEVHGFQEDEEAKSLSGESPLQVDSHIENFFGEEETEADEIESDEIPSPVVETATESELQDAEALSDAFFDIGGSDQSAVEVDKETALQGVNVETDADDDSDEEALPEFGGEIAPALMDSRDRSIFSEEAMEDVAPEEKLSDEVTGRLDAFFTDSEEETEIPSEDVAMPSVSAEVALQGVDVESEDDEEEGEDEVPASVVAGPAADSVFEDEVTGLEIEDNGEGDRAPAGLDSDFEALTETPNGADEELPGDTDEIAAGDLFGDLEESIEQSFDDIITEPVDEGEIDSALSETDDISVESIVEDTEVEAAFEDIDEQQETDSSEAEVAEQFDALFGETESESEHADEDVVFTLEDEDEEEDFESSQSLEVAEDDVIEEIASEIEEEDILETLSDEEMPAFGIEEESELEGPEPPAFIAGEEETVPLPELDEVMKSGEIVAPDIESDEEVVPATAESFIVQDSVEGEQILAELSGCVQSLAVEINDSVLQGLFAEVNKLRQTWADRPLNKSYLQLISTVAQHVDRYRYESSSESHELLMKLVQGLDKCISSAEGSHDIQEQLMVDTYQVLYWQQELLNKHAVKTDDGTLSFSGEVAEAYSEELNTDEEGDFADDFAAELESAMEENESFETEMGEIDTFVPEGDETVDAELEEVLSREVAAEGDSIEQMNIPDSTVTDIVRREIDALRMTLQQEIAELRSAIKGDSE